MTRQNYNKDDSSQASPNLEDPSSSEEGQILHLKRLLVTLKQHYEKNLHTLHVQLQAEQNQRIALKKELDQSQIQAVEIQKQHDEETKALRNQQLILKQLLKKSQEEAKSLAEQQLQLPPVQIEVPASIQNPSDLLRQDFEVIKTTLIQGVQESKALEVRYIDVLNEKIELEYRCKHLQQQMDQNSSHLASLQKQLTHLEALKNELVSALQSKETELNENQLLNEELQEQVRQLAHIEGEKTELAAALQNYETELNENKLLNDGLEDQIKHLNNLLKEKEFVEEKYEEVQGKWIELKFQSEQLIEKYKESSEAKNRLEQHSTELSLLVKEQDAHIHHQNLQLRALEEDYHQLASDREQLKNILEENEGRLKVSQQHLAKKVKESTLLAERVEEQEININDLLQTITQQKTQLTQLQSTIEFYQKEEKRLQEQLQDALKAIETQASKWEEKYFKIYDKLQENENIIRELKDVEKKHHQMKSMLTNLGAFMGNSYTPTPTNLQNQEPIEQHHRYHAVNAPFADEPIRLISDAHMEEKIDVFGMRQTVEKYKQNLSHE